MNIKNSKKIISFLLVFVILFSASMSFINVNAAPVAAKADVVFLIDSTASMGDEIDNVKRNIRQFMDYFDEAKIDLRLGFVEYRDITCDGDDSTIVYSGDDGEWHTNAESAIETLSKIEVDGGGDIEETAIDALGNLLYSSSLHETVPFDWDMNATRFAVLITDAPYKEENNHGISNMYEVIEAATLLFERKISISVITKFDFYDYYRELTDKTGGILADIDSYDYSELLKDFAETIIEYVDSDGDSLPDIWETEGADFDGDGIVDLPLHEMGADPNKKDIFVEVDWMVRPGYGSWFQKVSDHSFKPSENAMRMVYEAFAAKEINLHIDVGPDSTDFVTGEKWGDLSGGSEVAYESNLDLVDSYSPWSDIVEDNFALSRRKVFRHCLFADKFNGTTYSGLAANIPGQVFMVTLGGWGVVNDTIVAGTFMHELGHTLGLKHGGCDHEQFKPNYLSVMNYAYQTSGLVGTNAIDYSFYTLPALDSNSLDETKGLDPDGLTAGTGLGVRLYDSTGNDHIINNIASIPIDFDNDGNSAETNVSVVFYDRNGKVLGPVINSFNDWENLIFFGGLIGAAGEEYTIAITPTEKVNTELTYEKAVESGLLGNPGAVAITKASSYVILAGEEGQKLFLNVNNLSTEECTFTLTFTADIIDGSYTTEVTVGGSESELSSELISVPLIDDPKEGNYKISCTATSSISKESKSSVDILVYSPSEAELEELSALITSEDNSLPSYILEQYELLLFASATIFGNALIWFIVLIIAIVILLVVIVIVATRKSSNNNDAQELIYDPSFDAPTDAINPYSGFKKEEKDVSFGNDTDNKTSISAYDISRYPINNSFVPESNPTAVVCAGIKILTGSMRGYEIPMSASETVKLGKDSARCNIVFSSDYAKVSRLHCYITYSYTKKKYIVTDCSKNGTYYRDRRRLTSGNRIEVEPGTVLQLADKDCEIYLK